MPGVFGRKSGDQENRVVAYKAIDTDPITGEAVWAPILALEPASIGGGGGGGLTDAQLRATAVPVSGPLTDAQIRAVALPVSGTFWQATQPVSGPLTDVQLRAASVPISDGGGSLTVDGTFWQATQPVSGPLTDAQLRAVAVPVSGTFWQATQPVSGTFWQATQPVSSTQLPAALAAGGGIKVEGVAGGVAQPVSGTFWQATQPVSGTFWQATQPVSGTFWQATQPVSGTFWQATQPVSAVAMTDGSQIAQIRAATLIVTGTAAAGTGVTATLPAVAGQFHYITRISITKYASVATVGAAAPTVVTTTNLPGALAFTLPTALAVGTQFEHIVEPTSPIKSSVVNTATTIVSANLASIIYRITVYYYTAA